MNITLKAWSQVSTLAAMFGSLWNEPQWSSLAGIYTQFLSMSWTYGLHSNQGNPGRGAVRESFPWLGHQQTCPLLWQFSSAFSRVTLHGVNHLYHHETILVERCPQRWVEATAAWVNWQVDPIVVWSGCDWSWTNALTTAYGNAEPRGTQPSHIRFPTAAWGSKSSFF